MGGGNSMLSSGTAWIKAKGRAEAGGRGESQ